ncbi:hypothetical protein [Sphingomonas sp. J315]|uniref:hypothetical protein n=1 Tax=Sphingomonas sp. J315 TaxID=2898433 RepID=UPI0021ADFE73|nr:hypothetical protein [Sphingomonas sp. J315]UUY01200.1 hypothetical protein LRS08_09280 [Sphingomonas sp. J315]
MTPDAPVPTAPTRGNPMMMILGAVLVAFVTGLAVMAVVFRAGDWWGQAATAPVAVVQPPISAAPIAAPGMDVATLAAREQVLAARLESLDARLKATDADARVAASYAGRAEAMMLVFGARRALERGQELGIIAGELRRRLGGAAPEAVATVIAASGEPITLEDLRVAFDQIAPRLSTSQPDDGWLSAIQRELATLVIIRKQDAPSPPPARTAGARTAPAGAGACRGSSGRSLALARRAGRGKLDGGGGPLHRDATRARHARNCCDRGEGPTRPRRSQPRFASTKNRSGRVRWPPWAGSTGRIRSRSTRS